MKFVLIHDQARFNALEAIKNAPAGYEVTISEKTRSDAQNALLWPILKQFARQKAWKVNGKLEKLTPEEWKDILTASFYQEVRYAESLSGGGLVILGARTSKMGKKTFSEFIEFCQSSAHHLGVVL